MTLMPSGKDVEMRISREWWGGRSGEHKPAPFLQIYTYCILTEM